MRPMPTIRPSALLALASLVACAPGGTDRAAGETGGTLVISAPAEPRSLLPLFAPTVAEKQVVDQIFDALAEIGPDLNTIGDSGWAPRLAETWTWSADSLSITFRLDPDAKWHDGQPVRASDVRFSLELYKDPQVGAFDAPNLANVDSISVVDSITFVAWFKERSPEQFFKLAYYLFVMPERHLRDVPRAELASAAFARAPVGSGPFQFVEWEPRQSIEIVANTSYHRGRPFLDRVIWTLETEAITAVAKVTAGDADFRENVPPDLASRVASSDLARLVFYPMPNYGFVLFNHRANGDDSRPHPLFSSRPLRRALSMALDRPAMVRNVLDTLGKVSRGPFASVLPVADTTLAGLPYDPVAAAATLDSLGWRDNDGDGVRERNGIPLRFAVTVPATSPPRRRFAVLIQEQWRKIGARVDVEEYDPARLYPQLAAGRFDVFIHFVQTSPAPSSVAEAWAHPSPDRRLHNIGLYGNRSIEPIIDSAVSEFNAARSRDLYRRAYREIIEDAPAVWLYELRSVGALNKRVRPVLDRSDMWWRDLRLWWIPAGERIDRDRVALELTAR
ncbi:MAG TPA: peptide ABC transporter substrate-binding protein [Gemmatimonadaceae bacterium]